MKTIVSRGSRALRELANTLDIVRPSGPLTSYDIQNVRKNNDLCRRNRFPTSPMSSFDGSFNLVLPPDENCSKLLSFMGQLGETLYENDSYGTIMRTTYSGSRGTTITVLMEPTKFSSLVIKLANMPEVSRVEEQSYTADAYSNFPGRPEFMLGSSIEPDRGVRVRLQDAELVRQVPVSIKAGRKPLASIKLGIPVLAQQATIS